MATQRDPALEKFSGLLPLFPLPNAVMFPGTRLPLHVFEPRYRQMVQDVSAGEQLIGVVLLKPGWERNYFESPEVFPVACLGKLEQMQRLPDGRYNIRLVGLSRVRLGREVKKSPYRTCEVSLLEDRLQGPQVVNVQHHLDQTLQIFDGLLRSLAEFPGHVLLTRRNLRPGVLLDLLGSNLPLDPFQKQQLLEAVDVEERAARMVELLQVLQSDVRTHRKMRFRLFPKPSQN
ncbi:MAG: LON peptidase substrate-binding domain-containing protein [Candidatus Eremiobacterota bacterium]